jgi:hypothetical protein
MYAMLHGETEPLVPMRVVDSDGVGQAGLIVGGVVDENLRVAVRNDQGDEYLFSPANSTLTAGTAGQYNEPADVDHCVVAILGDVMFPGELEISLYPTVAGVTGSKHFRVRIYDARDPAEYLSETHLVQLSPPADAQLDEDAIAAAVLTADISGTIEDAAAVHSLCYVILALSGVDTTTNPGELTVFKTDGTTEFTSTTLTADANADPIVKLG